MVDGQPQDSEERLLETDVQGKEGVGKQLRSLLLTITNELVTRTLTQEREGSLRNCFGG